MGQVRYSRCFEIMYAKKGEDPFNSNQKSHVSAHDVIDVITEFYERFPREKWTLYQIKELKN